MPNKLLETVYEIDKVIKEVQGDEPSFLDALRNNPDFGKQNAQFILDILQDTAGSYPNVKARIEAAEAFVRNVSLKVDSQVSYDLNEIKRNLRDVQGVYGSLGEAISNASNIIDINKDQLDEMKISVSTETGVKSMVQSVPGGNAVFFPVDCLPEEFIGTLLIQDSYSPISSLHNFSSTESLEFNESGIEVSGTGSKLKKTPLSELFETVGGIYRNILGSHQEYEVNTDRVPIYGTKLFVMNQCSNIQSKTLQQLLTPWFSGKGTNGTSYYKGTKPESNIGENIVFIFSSPVWIDVIRAYPYTVENNENRYTLKCYNQNKDICHDSTKINPSPSGAMTPDVAVEHIIESDVVAISLNIGSGVSGLYSFFNSIEFYVTPLFAQEQTITASEKFYDMKDIERITGLTVNQNDYNTNGHAEIRYAWEKENKVYKFKPKNYQIESRSFLNSMGKRSVFPTNISKNTIANDIVVTGGFFYGRKPSITVPTNRTLNGDPLYWYNVYVQVYYMYITANGVQVSITSASLDTPISVNFGGIIAKVIIRSVSPSVIRIVVTCDTHPNLQCSNVYFNYYCGYRWPGITWSNFELGLFGKTTKAYTLYYSSYCISTIMLSGDLSQPGFTASMPGSYSGSVSMSNFKLPLTVYHIASDSWLNESFYQGIREDIIYSSGYSEAMSKRIAEKMEFGINETWIAKEHTKDWLYMKFSTIDYSGEVRFLLSFDNEQTWKTYTYGVWQETVIAGIKNGMVWDDLVAIPAVALDSVREDWLSIAVMPVGDSLFSWMRIDTGEDQFIEIDPNLVRYGMTNTHLISSVVGGPLSALLSPGNDRLGLKLKASLSSDDVRSPVLQNVNMSLSSYNHWRQLTGQEMDTTQLRFIAERQAELKNLSDTARVYRMNQVKPVRLTMIDKESGESLTQMIQASESYRESKQADALLVHALDRKMNQSMSFANSVFNKQYSNALWEMMIVNMISINKDIEYDGVTVNSFKTNCMTYDNSKVSYNRGSYSFQLLSVDYTTSLISPSKVIPEMVVEIRYDIIEKSVFDRGGLLSLVFDNVDEIDVTNTKSIRMSDIINTLGRHPATIALKITYPYIKEILSGDDILPKFTGYTTSGFTVSASSFYNSSYYPWYAVDNDLTQQHGWISQSGIPNGWLQFTLPTPRMINRFSIIAGTYMPQMPSSIVFDGFDGTRWIELYRNLSIPPWNNYEKRNYDFSNEDVYSSYRINILACHGGSYTGMCEFEMTYVSEMPTVNGYYMGFIDDEPFIGFGIVEVPIPFDDIVNVPVPLAPVALQSRNYKIKLNEELQTRDIDYQINYHTGKPILEWLKATPLKAADRLAIDILSEV